MQLGLCHFHVAHLLSHGFDTLPVVMVFVGDMQGVTMAWHGWGGGGGSLAVGPGEQMLVFDRWVGFASQKQSCQRKGFAEAVVQRNRAEGVRSDLKEVGSVETKWRSTK